MVTQKKFILYQCGIIIGLFMLYFEFASIYTNKEEISDLFNFFCIVPTTMMLSFFTFSLKYNRSIVNPNLTKEQIEKVAMHKIIDSFCAGIVLTTFIFMILARKLLYQVLFLVVCFFIYRNSKYYIDQALMIEKRELLQKYNKEETNEKSKQCKICFKFKVNTILEPCGHKSCIKCLKGNQCRYCLKEIHFYKQLFFV